MKHMVRMQITVQAGHDIEARPGGPGPVMGRLVERFKPEAMYMCPSRREVIMVCDLDSASMAELMIAGSHLAGSTRSSSPSSTGRNSERSSGRRSRARRRSWKADAWGGACGTMDAAGSRV